MVAGSVPAVRHGSPAEPRIMTGDDVVDPVKASLSSVCVAA